MKQTELLELAISLAVEGHKGQIDREGKPYILHPLHLMNQVNQDEEKIVAVLHDLIEDTEMEIEELAQLGFPLEIVEAIDLLTHREGVEYETYVDRIGMNSLARTVKLADLNHNMDVRRLPVLQEKDLQRLKKYHLAQQQLMRIESSKE